MNKQKDRQKNAGTLVNMAEYELVKKAAAGDVEAFEKLVAGYDKRIFNLGLKMLGNRDDAADMTQEVLLKLYRSLHTFRGDSSLSTWIYRISANTCRDMLRSAYRRKVSTFSAASEEDEAAEPEVADYSAIPEDVVLDQEHTAYLAALISGLSPKYRLVTALREVSGLSYQEIAAAANISVGTVKSRLNRARAAMRQQALRDAEKNPTLLHLMKERGKENDE